MAETVSTGWRTLRPGACVVCGYDDDWDCDGRGTIYCGCQCCADCGIFDGHEVGCAELKRLLQEAWDAEDAAVAAIATAGDGVEG